jgi:hypothetical protein
VELSFRTGLLSSAITSQTGEWSYLQFVTIVTMRNVFWGVKKRSLMKCYKTQHNGMRFQRMLKKTTSCFEKFGFFKILTMLYQLTIMTKISETI